MATPGSLIFTAGIKFDKNAGASDKDIQDVLNYLQTKINKNELWVKLGIDPNSITFLKNYNKSAQEIDKTMKGVARAIQEVQKRGQYWDASGTGMTQKAQKLQQIYHELAVLRKTSSLTAVEFEKMLVNMLKEETKERERNAKLAQKQAEALAKAEEKKRQALLRSNNLLNTQDGYLKHLIQRLTVYASIGAVGAFLTKIREVTAEFELQRISLGAIIQDQNKANALFFEIKNFALQSPLKILDLTKYTKQLAAYRIETDKLFDTTKRLADISVGLGVDMQRLILFYGQVRATGYLRASEVRQATEAGIPLVEELAKKLSDANGQLVTAADVMDMISKRAISFEQVAEVFDDMTNKGGVFYNMQEKQGNTLYGMWQKLGDAAAMMYDEIGNTSWVNAGIKEGIELLRSFMLSWRDVARGVLVASSAFVVWKANSAIITTLMTKTALLVVAQDRLTKSRERLNTALSTGRKLLISVEKLQLKAAQSSLAAARAQGVWRTAALKLQATLFKLRAAMLANWPTIAFTAIFAGWEIISSYIEKANRLKNALKEIQEQSISEQAKSVRNFESLVAKALSPTSTQKEQRDALEELHNTYGKIIPIEDLHIDKLKSMQGNYALLTEAIRENIAEQKRQEGITTILDTYAEKIKKAEDALKKQFGRGLKIDGEIVQFNEEQISRIITNYENYIKEISELHDGIVTENDMGGGLFKAFGMEGIYLNINTFREFQSLLRGNTGVLYNLGDAITEQEQKLKDWDKSAKNTYATLGLLADLMKEAEERIKNATYTNEKGTYSYDEEVARTTIESYISELKSAFYRTGLYIDLDKFIHFNTDGSLEAIDWEAMIAKIDEYQAQFDQKKNEMLAKIAAYRKQASAEAAKGKETDENIVQSYLARANEIQMQLGQYINPENLKNNVEEVRKIIGEIVPSDPVVQKLKLKMQDIAQNIWGNLDAGMNALRKYIWDGKKELHKQYKDWQDQLELLEADIYKYDALVRKFGYSNEDLKTKFGIDLADMKKEAQGLRQEMQAALPYIPPTLLPGGKNKGSKSDPRLQLLNNIASTMEKINKEYDDLLKKEGQTKALADTQRLFAAELDNMQKIANKHGFKLPAFEVPKNANDVAKWYKAVADEIRRLKLKDADKILIELGYKEGKVDIDEMQKQIEARLKELSERISASKTAREFYDKILSQTGDVDIAASVTMSIYGDTGEGLFEQTIAQIREVFKSGISGVNIPIDTAFDFTNNVIDYGKLAKIYEEYQDKLIEANKSTALKIVQEGQKTAAQNVLTWQKELEKAKDFEQQRTDILKRETERRAAIIKSNIPQDMKDQLIGLSYDKQAKDIAGVNVKEFQASEDYIKIFEKLDKVSTAALKRLRTNLAEIIQQNKDLNPENMKQLVKALEQIDDQIEGRGFGNEMINSVKQYFGAVREMKAAKAELKQAQAEYNEQEIYLNGEIEMAMQAQIQAQEELDRLKASGVATTEEIKFAELGLNQATAAVVKAQEKKAKAVDKVKKKEQKVTDLQDDQRDATEKFFDDLKRAAQAADQLASILGDVKDLIGVSEDSAAGVAFDSAIEGLQTFSKTMTTIIALQELYNVVTESNPWIAIAAAVLAVASILGNWVSNEKVRKANKILKQQEEILHQLEYSYDRLQKAQEKMFGTEYIRNYNKQLSNLNAQAEAYRKQYQAEKSKGKKADEDAMRDYADKWRETMDEIKDMRTDLQEYLAGTDLTSAARDWANSWLEARWSFEDTTQAMKDSFADMVQNMIVESMAAKLMEGILKPVYNEIDQATKDERVTAEEIARIAEVGYAAIADANIAMEGLMTRLQEAGLNLQEMFGEQTELTGISRDIATASEESINGLAQGINTQNYYIAMVSENVAVIRAMMEGGAVGASGAGTGMDLISLQNEHLSQLPMIEANTRLTAERCERAALACEAIQSSLERVVVGRGNRFAVRTEM